MAVKRIRLLTMGEVAEQLSVSTREVERWLARGDLSSVKFGPRCRRIDEAVLLKFIDVRRERSEIRRGRRIVVKGV